MSMTALVKQLEDKGRNGDTILAHINPEEAQLLKDNGGSGTINPETGIMEFGILSDLWSGFKATVKKIAPVIIPAVAIFYPPLIPMIGTALGASGAAAGIVGAAALSAGVTLASGGSLKDVLTSAALAGASAYLTPIAGKFLTPTGSSVLAQTMAGSAAVSAGYTAMRGGTVKEMLAAAATGAASAYIGNVAKDAVAKMNNMMASGTSNTISQKGATDAVFAGADAANLKAAGMSEAQISKTLQGTGMDALTADYAASMATKGYTADTIAANLAANKTNGIYNGDANTKSITAGNNSELVQKIEDANFVAKDAAQLKAQGLSQAGIVQNLVASGVDVNTANYVASQAMTGLNETQLADKLVNSTGFISSGKVYTSEDFVGRQLGQVMTNEQRDLLAAKPFSEQIKAGTLTLEEAGVLGRQGVTPTDLDNLTKLGYTASDVSDMVGAGVKPQTLVNLANTKFTEAQISNLLTSGVSANDISNASVAINNYKNLSTDEAAQLLTQGKSGTQIMGLASSNQLPSQQAQIEAQKEATRLANLTPAEKIAETKLFNQADSTVLANAGYTDTDVKNLLNTGYQASDLVDLASTGVPASTLTQLASSPIPENNIAQLLENGVSANDIANTGQFIKSGQLSLEQANTLLDNNFNSNQIRAEAVNGTANSTIRALNNGLNVNSIAKLQASGADVNAVSDYIEKGYMSSQSINNGSLGTQQEFNKLVNGSIESAKGLQDLAQREANAKLYPENYTVQGPKPIGNGVFELPGSGLIVDANNNIVAENYNDYLAKHPELRPQQPAQPVQPETVAQQPLTPVQQEVIPPGTSAVAPVEIAQAPVTATTVNVNGTNYNIDPADIQTSKYFDNPNEWLAKLYGIDTPEGIDKIATMTSQQGQPVVTQAPPNTIDVGGGNFMDQYGNIVDSQGNITKPAVVPSAPVTTTATGYTPQQEAQYNELIRQGMSPADAVRQIDTGAAATPIAIGGSAGFAENPNNVVQEYRTPNTDLATQQQIDSGAASYNAGANAWEVPSVQEVVVTAPRPEQPYIPIITPIVPQQPTAPVAQQPVVTPPAPVVPQQPTQPTVVSSSTRTTMDGSTYKDEQMSDGTVNTILISGPSTGGTGTGTGTGTGGTTQPPLSPIQQEVIPPGSSYVAPVEVTPPLVDTTPETPTETPVDTTPYVPILTPQEPIMPDIDNYRGKYTLGAPIRPNIPNTLNPGWITNVPNYYNTTNSAQSKYYWGGHPYQTGTTFNPTLYNQAPNAPATPFGLGFAQGPATGQQIINAMQGVYPLLNTVAGPVRP